MTTMLTRDEQASAYADLYEVPLAEVHQRYGAVLLSDRETVDVKLDMSEVEEQGAMR